MSYTKVEQFILLGLKERWNEAVERGADNTAPVGSVEELWRAVDAVFRYWNEVSETEEDSALVKEKIFDVLGCTEADIRKSLSLLVQEGLIGFRDSAWEELKRKEKLHSADEGHFYRLLSRGFRACREFECPV